MGLIATLLPAPPRLDRVRAALGDRHGTISCGSWEALATACGRRAVTVAIVDLFPVVPSTNQRPAFEVLRRFKRRFPSVAVLLYTSAPPARPHDLFEAGRFGIDGLVLAGRDDEPRRLRAIVDRAEASGALALLRPALGDVKPTVRDAVMLCVSRAHQQLTPDDLARILGLRRKLLSARLSQAGFPTSQRLIAWGRMIVAARLLEDRERTADSVALALDYPSGSAFRNACQRYVGAAPHLVRARGGAAYVIAQLLAQVDERSLAAGTGARAGDPAAPARATPSRPVPALTPTVPLP